MDDDFGDFACNKSETDYSNVERILKGENALFKNFESVSEYSEPKNVPVISFNEITGSLEEVKKELLKKLEHIVKE